MNEVYGEHQIERDEVQGLEVWHCVNCGSFSVDKSGLEYYGCKEKVEGESSSNEIEKMFLNGGELDKSTMKGAVLDFARKVDEIKVPKGVFGLEDNDDRVVTEVTSVFNQWLHGRLGNDWIRFYMNGDGVLDEMHRSVKWAVMNSDEFNEILDDKMDFTVSMTDKVPRNLEGWVNKHGKAEKKEYNNEVEEMKGVVNTVIHGDSRKVIESIVKGEGRIVDAMITDPPYLMRKRAYNPGHTDKYGVIEGQTGSSYQTLKLFEDVMKKSRMVLKDGAPILVFCDGYSFGQFEEVINEHFEFQQSLIWDKQRIGTSQTTEGPKWRPKHELIIYGGYRGKPNKINENRHDGTIISVARKHGTKYLHPNDKPVELLRYLVESVTDEGDVVMDPFSGAGSTLVAADQLGRDYIGIEVSERYANVCKDRLNQERLMDI